MRCLVPLAAVFTVLVPAPEARADERPRVVVLGVSASTEKLSPLAASVTEQVLTELERPGTLDVMGTSDVAAALGLERQRQMLGCSESATSCLAEVSAALGAPWLVSGALSRSGKTLRLDLKLVRATDGKVFFRDGQSIRDESAVYDVVATLVRRLLDKGDFRVVSPPAPTVVLPAAPAEPARVVPEVLPPPAVAVSPPVVAPRSTAGAWVTMGAGAVAIAAGAVVLGLGAGLTEQTRKNLTVRPSSSADERVLDYATARARLNAGSTQLLVGGVLVGVGALTLLGGLGWRLLGDDGARPAPLEVTLGFSPTGLVAHGSF